MQIVDLNGILDRADTAHSAVIDGGIQIANGNVGGGLLQIGLGVLTAATTLPNRCAGKR